ncbi:MAG: HD domain-containing protein [Bacteroidales bacterium]|nr:HD domain-containing protein [Bacteroidales bacterium]
MTTTLAPLNYKQKSVRETVVDALSYLGIHEIPDFDLKPEYFDVPDRGIHDARHLYRVMIAAALIAHKLNEPRAGLLAFCGAFIHDLARCHDGEDTQHGPRAAKNKWEMFAALWDKYGLSDEEQSNVRAAVSRHSGGGNSGYHDNMLVNQILHDADALDRCRFHLHGRLDWSYLAHPELKCTNDRPSPMLKALIGETETICATTKYLPTYLPFKDFLENIR